jgi:hypothetical protein
VLRIGQSQVDRSRSFVGDAVIHAMLFGAIELERGVFWADVDMSTNEWTVANVVCCMAVYWPTLLL